MMKKLIRGILDFQRHVLPHYRRTFRRLATAQKPHYLVITCVDSRVVPNLVMSADPGDLFLVRNVGNLVPPAGDDGLGTGDSSVGAAIEYAVTQLGVRHIIVCGHSDCGAMRGVYESGGAHGVGSMPNLAGWLQHARPSLERQRRGEYVCEGLTPPNELSQVNVLQQVEHVKTYAAVRDAMARGEMHVHAWWFDIPDASLSWYRPELQAFVPIDETDVEHALDDPDEPEDTAALAI